MAINPNVGRVPPETDLTDYTQQEASSDRIDIVADPLGQRGNVVRIIRNTGDAAVSSGLRAELARDVFSSERAFNTGGGFYHTSYMLGETWAQYVQSGYIPNPDGNNAGIVIKQFHPATADGFTHPIWAVAVLNDGVQLRKWDLDDASTYSVKARWPVDSMRWHDIVFGVVYNRDCAGKFLCWLDGVLIHREEGQQIYTGASSGCWYSEGIYSTGGERTGVDTLTMYVQGYRQGYPTGVNNLYSDVVGLTPVVSRIPKTRSLVTRSTVDRSTVVRGVTSLDVAL